MTDAQCSVEDAARVMRERKIGCLPVVDDGRVIGIITGIDLLDAKDAALPIPEDIGHLPQAGLVGVDQVVGEVHEERLRPHGRPRAQHGVAET